MLFFNIFIIRIICHMIIMSEKINLIITNNIMDIKYYNKKYLKYYYKYEKLDILYQILGNQYYFITQYPYKSILEKIKNKIESNHKTLFNINKNIIIKNNIVHIQSHTLSSIVKMLDSNTFNIFFLNTLFINNPIKSVTLIKVVDIRQIKNKKLYLSHNIENYLSKNFNLDITTIFLYINFSSSKEPEYDEIIGNNDYKYVVINCNELSEFDNMKKYIENSDIILVSRLHLFNYVYCIGEAATLTFYLYFYNKILYFMKDASSLYLHFGICPNNKPTIELLYFVSTLFEKIHMEVDYLNILFFGYIKFENYIQNIKKIKNNLDNFCTKCSISDPYLGQNSFVEGLTLKYCDNMDNNFRKPHTNTFIKSIIKIPENDNFIKIFNHAKKQKYKMQKKFMKRVKYMISLGDKIDINSIILNNISKSMNYCKKHNIDIIDIYKENKIVNSDVIIKKYFLNYYNNKKINTNEIQLSVDSVFSITRPLVAKQMSEIIKKTFPTIEYMIDGCANIGTTTIIFAQYFKHVYSIEYDINTFNIFRHNIGLYQVKNTTLFNADTTLFMKDTNMLNNIKYDINTFILCLDPPWDGVFYKINTQLDLYLSNINILDFIKDIDVKYIAIKAPNNYNFTKLYNYFYNVTIHRLGGFYFILIVK